MDGTRRCQLIVLACSWMNAENDKKKREREAAMMTTNHVSYTLGEKGIMLSKLLLLWNKYWRCVPNRKTANAVATRSVDFAARYDLWYLHCRLMIVSSYYNGFCKPWNASRTSLVVGLLRFHFRDCGCTVEQANSIATARHSHQQLITEITEASEIHGFGVDCVTFPLGPRVHNFSIYPRKATTYWALCLFRPTYNT